MDIHAKSVDMDGKFHIHGIPDNHEWCRPILVYGTRLLTNVITVSRNVKKVIYPGQCTQCADRLRWMSFEVVTAIACRHWRRGRPRMTAGHIYSQYQTATKSQDHISTACEVCRHIRRGDIVEFFCNVAGRETLIVFFTRVLISELKRGSSGAVLSLICFSYRIRMFTYGSS